MKQNAEQIFTINSIQQARESIVKLRAIRKYVNNQQKWSKPLPDDLDLQVEQEKEVKAILFHKEKQTKLDNIYPKSCENITFKESQIKVCKEEFERFINKTYQEKYVEKPKTVFEIC